MLLSSHVSAPIAQSVRASQPSPRDFARVRDSVSGHMMNHSALGPNKIDRRTAPAREHRRSRESPDGDSETDDSEFLAPHHASSAHNTSRGSAEYGQKPRTSAEWKRDRPVSSASGNGAGVAAEGSPGVATAYNTYLNAGAGRGRRPSADSVDTETRCVSFSLLSLLLVCT